MQNLHPLVAYELNRLRRGELRVIPGASAAELPAAVTELASAGSPDAAERAYWRLDNRCVFESAVALVSVLIAAPAVPATDPSDRVRTAASELPRIDLIDHLERYLGEIECGWAEDADGHKMPFQVPQGSGSGTIRFATLG